jgi:phage replication O-like protein O
MRISSPTYTQTPNDLFDHWLPLLGEGELKVLLVIMRKTFGWHKTHDAISVSQLSKLTGMKEDTVIKAAKSLQKKGVITRSVVGKNGAQQTIYSLVVEEESNNSYPPLKTEGLKDRPLRSNPPVQTEAQKKPSSSKEKEQQQEAVASAAVSLKNQDHPTQRTIYSCLESIDIPKKEKVWLTRTYDEETIQHAIAWATSDQTNIKTTLVQAIKWACLNRPETPKDPKEQVKANKELAKHYDEQANGYAKINALSKAVEIVPFQGQNSGVYIEYTERDFVTKFEEARKKYRF